MTTLSRSCLFRTDRRALLLSTPLSSRQPTVRRPWFGDYPAGGLFSPHARIWVEGSENHNPPALFFFFFVEIRSRALIPLWRQESVHSGSSS